jgi:hypothetical protein
MAAAAASVLAPLLPTQLAKQAGAGFHMLLHLMQQQQQQQEQYLVLLLLLLLVAVVKWEATQWRPSPPNPAPWTGTH